MFTAGRSPLVNIRREYVPNDAVVISQPGNVDFELTARDSPAMTYLFNAQESGMHELVKGVDVSCTVRLIYNSANVIQG